MNSAIVFNPEQKKRLIEADAEMHMAFDDELDWLEEYRQELIIEKGERYENYTRDVD